MQINSYGIPSGGIIAGELIGKLLIRPPTLDGNTFKNVLPLFTMRTLLPVVGCGNLVAKLVGVTYSNTFTPYEHTEVVADEVVLALNAALTVYSVSEMFNDAVCVVVTNDEVSALVKNEPVSSLDTNDDVSALVRNEPVAALIVLIEPVKYSKLPSSSSCVNGAPLVERSVRFAIF
jgi:hypothetical protein